MFLRIAFISMVFGLLSGCGGSSAPADGAPASTTPASTAAPPATTAAEAPKVAAADPSLCILGKSDTWSSCIGKRVEVRGKEPKMVYQHPMVAPMALPGTAPAMQQSYLETAEGSQVIVISEKTPKCGEAKRVTGILREINLGGPAGTKESYRGWSINDATITCE